MSDGTRWNPLVIRVHMLKKCCEKSKATLRKFWVCYTNSNMHEHSATTLLNWLPVPIYQIFSSVNRSQKLGQNRFDSPNGQFPKGTIIYLLQMLLDTYVLKKGFEDLLAIALPPKANTPSSYLKRVAQSMSRIDPVLKTLQVRPSPLEALVQAYLIHIADKSDVNFRKILELKGIVRKQDQAHLIDLFQAHRASPRNNALPQSSSLFTNLGFQPPSSTTAGANLASGLGSLSTAASVSTANLQARFDPATLGNAIMSAARDGVDRFGSPAIVGNSSLNNQTSGTSTTTATAAQQQQQQPAGGLEGTGGAPAVPAAGTSTPGNLNENLRNIGKFFKRDMVSWRS